MEAAACFLARVCGADLVRGFIPSPPLQVGDRCLGKKTLVPQATEPKHHENRHCGEGENSDRLRFIFLELHMESDQNAFSALGL